MGKRYGQLGIEDRTIIQVQLEMGIKPAAIALGLNRSASMHSVPREAALRMGPTYLSVNWRSCYFGRVFLRGTGTD